MYLSVADYRTVLLPGNEDDTMSCPSLDLNAAWSGRPSGCGFLVGLPSPSMLGPALLSWRLGFAAVPDVPHSGGPAGVHAHEECVHFIASHKLKALSPEHWPLSAKVTDLPCVCS